MKTRMYQWMFSAIIICGTMFFTACSDDDNSVNPDRLAEKLVGKWIFDEMDGGPYLTSDKVVVTFLSASKAIVSYSKSDFEESGTKRKWSDYREYNVVIDGDKVIMTGYPNETITLVDEMVISFISDNEIKCNYVHITYRNGEELVRYGGDTRMVKTTVDYRQSIVGTWEAQISDGQYGRWKFNADGTYSFYLKNGDSQWQSFNDEFSDYFVDGPLLCMRWKPASEQDEQRDWREIVSLNGTTMRWTLYTQNDSGIPYTENMVLTKVE